jgi:hypothetical protein
MILFTCVREEGGDGEEAGSETPSLLSYTLRYAGRVSRIALYVPHFLRDRHSFS